MSHGTRRREGEGVMRGPPKLPSARRHQGAEVPDCPWCGVQMDDFFVRWESVTVEDEGRRACVVSALGECPDCGRPVKVVELRRENSLTGRTEAEWTDKDRQFLREVRGESI